jgi:phosphoglycerate dehydrogenase-like enzyme
MNLQLNGPWHLEKLAYAGLDVFDPEPLPKIHTFGK